MDNTLTSKQRARLRGLANSLETLVQIGKEGITEGVLRQLDQTLEKRELVKVRLLDTALLTPREASEELCRRLEAQPVQCIGTKAVLYRRAREKENRKILLD